MWTKAVALSGETCGATRFHRHDDWPDWARDAEPAALMGSYFFYRDAEDPDA